jgi:ABC-type transporter Mla maintaining outer membrane lipid asymmetry ATPase subunit MlaF
MLLHDGGVAFQGSTEELVHSSDPWIKEYLS